MATTLFASGPFAPSTASNCTCAPSASDLKPSPAIEEWWTNTSLPPSAGVMNPYPFASLNHFTVPVAIQKHLLHHERTGRGSAPRATRYSLRWRQRSTAVDDDRLVAVQLAQTLVADPEVVCDLVQDDAADLGAQEICVPAVEPLERSLVDRDLVRKHAGVLRRAPR